MKKPSRAAAGCTEPDSSRIKRSLLRAGGRERVTVREQRDAVSTHSGHMGTLTFLIDFSLACILSTGDDLSPFCLCQAQSASRNHAN